MSARVMAIVTCAALLSLVPAVAGATERSTLDLSSWTPVTKDSEIIGGTRTVTVMNYREETLDGVVFDLGISPCDCSIASLSATRGSMSGSDWSIGRLQPGETVTLTISYVQDERASAPQGATHPRDAAALTFVAVVGSLGILALDRKRSPVTQAV